MYQHPIDQVGIAEILQVLNVHIKKDKCLAKPKIFIIHVNVLLCPCNNNNLLLTEREGCTGEYWPEVVAVQTERSEVRTKTTEGQYSPVQLEQARLVSSLLYGTRVMLVSK